MTIIFYFFFEEDVVLTPADLFLFRTGTLGTSGTSGTSGTTGTDHPAFCFARITDSASVAAVGS